MLRKIGMFFLVMIVVGAGTFLLAFGMAFGAGMLLHFHDPVMYGIAVGFGCAVVNGPVAGFTLKDI